MRLLKTGPYLPGDERFEVIQKWGQDIPPYAILSHTWSSNADDEVLLADVAAGICDQKPAYVKVRNAMERAQLDGFAWLWIDTCCIDKTNSVELNEAINSMYGYYKNSQKCYAYLSDVESEKPGPLFQGSKWFTRGWTLQELLAPRNIEFFNSKWKSIGHKDGLSDVIAEKTGINSEYLNCILPVEHASVAKRMSWQASRETTRDEDIAYSMIGLFDVNMPMLYGEGATKAFLRLQEEIMKAEEDQSLFAWVKDSDGVDASSSHHSLLADSPRDFKRTGDTIPYTSIGNFKPPSMTGRGLSLELHLTFKNDANGTAIAALHCPVFGQGSNNWLALYLQKLPMGTNQFARIHCDRLASVSSLGKSQEVYVRQKFPTHLKQVILPWHWFQIRRFKCTSDFKDIENYRIVQSITKPADSIARQGQREAPPHYLVRWSVVSLLYPIEKTAGSLSTALLIKRSYDREAFVVMLGASSDLEVGFAVHDACEFGAFETLGYTYLQSVFKPQHQGDSVQLRYHHVRICFEECIRDNKKIYFVDIDIKGLPKLPPATEALEEGTESALDSSRGTSKSEFRDKMKRRFLSK